MIILFSINKTTELTKKGVWCICSYSPSYSIYKSASMNSPSTTCCQTCSCVPCIISLDNSDDKSFLNVVVFQCVIEVLLIHKDYPGLQLNLSNFYVVIDLYILVQPLLVVIIIVIIKKIMSFFSFAVVVYFMYSLDIFLIILVIQKKYTPSPYFLQQRHHPQECPLKKTSPFFQPQFYLDGILPLQIYDVLINLPHSAPLPKFSTPLDTFSLALDIYYVPVDNPFLLVVFFDIFLANNDYSRSEDV